MLEEDKRYAGSNGNIGQVKDRPEMEIKEVYDGAGRYSVYQIAGYPSLNKTQGNLRMPALIMRTVKVQYYQSSYNKGDHDYNCSQIYAGQHSEADTPVFHECQRKVPEYPERGSPS